MGETGPMAIVLAAGKGTRMQSELPKVLCPVLGRPMIEYVLDALCTAGLRRICLVVGYRGDLVRQAVERWSGRDAAEMEFVEQRDQLGTGHAVIQCQEHLADISGPVAIVTGDSPLLQPESLTALLAEQTAHHSACVLGTLHKQDPFGLGRIVRDEQGDFVGIVEERDATPSQRLVTEVNMSTYLFDAPQLRWALDRLTDDNLQREYYITDCPGILRREGKDVRALPVLRPCEALSINTPEELAMVEAELRNMGA